MMSRRSTAAAHTAAHYNARSEQQHKTTLLLNGEHYEVCASSDAAMLTVQSLSRNRSTKKL
jgi:hypothetical protein